MSYEATESSRKIKHEAATIGKLTKITSLVVGLSVEENFKFLEM